MTIFTKWNGFNPAERHVDVMDSVHPHLYARKYELARKVARAIAAARLVSRLLLLHTL